MTHNLNYSVQEIIFHTLEAKLGDRTKLRDFLCKQLSIGKSAAYKRLSNDISLTLVDTVILMRAAEIPLDQFVLPHYAGITFSGDALRKLPESYDQYLQNVVNTLGRVSKIPNLECTTAGHEIPLFHFANFPKLYNFKLYYWNETFWKFGPKKELFDFRTFEHQVRIKESCNKIGELYYTIPTKEIWTDDILDPIMKQIVYYLKIQRFRNTNDALELMKDLSLMSKKLEDFCTDQKKTIQNGRTIVSSHLDVFYNELHDGTDVLIFGKGEQSSSFIKYDGPNFIRTSHQEFGKYSMDWIKNVLNKSSHISGPGEKERTIFFSRINKKIADTREEVEKLIAES